MSDVLAESAPATAAGALSAEGLGKRVRLPIRHPGESRDHELTILDDVSFTIGSGEAVAVVGASGSGKSTLLSLLAGLDTPSAGVVRLDGVALSELDEDGRARVRGAKVGFVFQSFQLLPALTALENVMLPLELRGDRDAQAPARRILERVGLGERLEHYPRQLSGGEQQRVALARAFVTEPDLLFADEPTGNLDTETGRAVMDLLFELNSQHGTTLVLVTHDERLAARCGRILRLAAGRLVGMKVLGLAWRQLRRDLAAGEIRILIAALVLGVMAVSAVGFLTDRAGRALALEANRLLGGDAVVRADAPMGDEWPRRAQAAGVQYALTRAFPSMIGVGSDLRLGDVRAIGDGFPLRGRFRIRDANGEHVPTGVPARGTVWMSSAGMRTLGAKLGDRVALGATQPVLAGEVLEEPDAALNYFFAGPKVFLNLADLPATGLEQEGSRITYRFVVAGAPAAVEKFVAQARPALGRGQRLETAADARPEIRSALDRASRFLGLAALVSVVLSAIAVAMAARRHSARHLSGAAVMRCLGASQRMLLGIHLGELLLLGLAGSAIGVACAWGLQEAIAWWLQGKLGVAVPPAGWRPALEGLGVGLTVLMAFGAPPVLALRRVSALRVLRRDLDTTEPSAWVVALLGLGGLALLLWWKAGSPELATAMLVGLGATFAALALLALALILVLRRVRAGLRGPWRYGLANVSRRTGSSVAQIASLGLGLMVLLLLTLVRTDLLSRWRDAMPADAPNRFVINVQPDQVDAVRAHLEAAGIAAPDLFPMVRARLVEVNDRRVTGKDFAERGQRSQRMAEREFNLSQASRLRPDNQVVAGEFWAADVRGPVQFSVEEEFAEGLGWKVGDRIAFDVGGERLAGPVTSLRKVDWESFQPNFFVLATPGALAPFPSSHIGGVHVTPAQAGFTRDLVARFPNLTVIDLDAVLEQVRGTVDQVSTVVQAVFYFSLAAGLLVLFAAVSASQDERLLEGAVMRVLGGNRRQLLLAQASEFAAIGLLAGLTAAIAATLLAGVVAQEVLGLPWRADWRLALSASGAGALAAMVAGLLATRRVLSAPPSVTLRALQD